MENRKKKGWKREDGSRKWGVGIWELGDRRWEYEGKNFSINKINVK
jgi:hypothetical protein